MKIFSKVFMVLLLSVSFSVVFGQKYYDDQWKKIEENTKKGTYKSNLPSILEIQKQAMKENNILQLIRSLKEEFGILNTTADDDKNDSASTFFAKIHNTEKQLTGEGKVLFNVLVNTFFTDYYHQNLWKIKGRANLNSQDVSQIETWTKLDFKNYLTAHFKELDLLRPEMKNIALSKYESIFSGTKDLSYFPTLADWYDIEKINFLSDNQLFTKNELSENKSKIDSVFDGLIAQNKGNSKLYFMHKRLEKNCSFNHCKDKLQQLKNLVSFSTEGDYKVLIMEQIMSEQIAKKEQKAALEIASLAKAQYPKSPFIDNIKNIEEQIKAPSLSFYYEQQAQPNLPIHFSVDHKNVSEFSLDIYEVKDDFTAFLQYIQNPYADGKGNSKKNWVRKETFKLLDAQDFQNHSTSLEIQPLPPGAYIVEYRVEGSENQDRQIFYFLVSNNKIIYQNKGGHHIDLSVLKLVNSENGKPVSHEDVNFYELLNGKKLHKTSGKTDEKGIFKFPTDHKEYYRTYLIEQPKSNDLQLFNVYGEYNYSDGGLNKENRIQAQIFTDRAIYRPGQTVYFKVINTTIDKEIESVASGIKQKITLKDANDQEITSQNFITNEWGSYHGSFILPKGKLNGSFTLQTDGKINGYKTIRVEEYKRPKFEVKFEPVKGDYQYGQAMELKGKAVMFSGIALNNTTVYYEIKKRNIRWRYFGGYPLGNDNENSILGEVKTNEKGEFSISLTLKKEEGIEGIQIDNYEINVSVTDINGETQSADNQLKVASVSHYIKTDEIKNTFSDENIKLNVETKNYNEQELKKSYHVKLSKIQKANRIFRDNFKTVIQDQPMYSKEEFYNKFPHDFYDKNDQLNNGKVEKVVIDKIQQSANLLEIGKLEAGSYQLELYNIEGKDTIKTSQYFNVWDRHSLKSNQKTFLTVLSPKNEFLRGEKAKIYVYSAIPNALVTVFIQSGLGKTVSEVHSFKNGLLEYTVDLPKDPLVSTLNLQFQIVAFNDVQTESIDLKIKNTDRPLTIETVTFRDKLEPNSKEKWLVKVIGNEREKINAEVLATMYDRSLDQLAANSFSWQKLYIPYSIVSSYSMEQNLASGFYQKRSKYLNSNFVDVPQFNWFDGSLSRALQGGVPRFKTRGAVTARPMMANADAMTQKDKVELRMNEKAEMADEDLLDKSSVEQVPIRQNLNETSFFYPDLKTDSEGNVNFEFTSSEALTTWKLMFLAHTKDARAAILEKEVVTQKDFSVTPNYPRFLREGDELNLQSKLSNLTNKKLSGSSQLQIFDAFTNEDISEKFGLQLSTAVSGYSKEQAFSVDENGNSVLAWKIKVPNNVSSVILKVVAKAGKYSDGEQKAVAILPNRMLVTEAVPIFVKEGETKTFVLDHLKNTGSTTVSNVSNTLELTTNPIWEIMFALPSLKNDQSNSADVIFNKWFADVLASEIFRANPKMKAVFEEYQNKGLLASNLEKNQELKQLLLEETPWVLESKNEQDQMQKLSLLFDVNNMRNAIRGDWEDLKKLQNPDGGFSWYPGYPSSYSTSLYILKNLGKINAWLNDQTKEYQTSEQKELVNNLIKYVDNEVDKYYDVKKENALSNWSMDYLDTRNYWEKDYPLKGKGGALRSLVQQKVKTTKLTDFTFFGLHRAALLMRDYGLKESSDKVLNYLKETSIDSKTQGVYWKQNLDGWGWFSSKVVNQAGALEAFSKLRPNDPQFIEDLKIWLITQKEVNSWGSSRGTSEVIFTILNSGKSWTSVESDKASITWGGKELQPKTQATGYVKSVVTSNEIDKKLASVTITKPGAGIVQGGLFWQYYEDLDQIKSSENYLSITKELYKKIKTVNGEELQKITSETPLKVGDRVTVRMVLNTDRPMEFIHIKDMRAAGFEPVDVFSGYRLKNNLGYYQSTKDASTHFYIQYMPKGKYVFEYDYVANASGTFLNGITTMQNYYAPQMNTHTKGTGVQILE